MSKSWYDSSVSPDTQMLSGDFSEMGASVVPPSRQALGGARSSASKREMAPNPASKLIAKLERMADATIPAEWYVDLLRAYKPLVLKMTAVLPKPDTDVGGDAPPLTPQQRLNQALIRNLTLALAAVDKAEDAYTDEAANRRLWLVKTAFYFLSAQVDYAVRWRRPWAPGTWKVLHDTHQYLIRREARWGDQFVIAGTDSDSGFDPHEQYKRLLLHGVLHEAFRASPLPPPAHALVGRWAKEAQLRDPSSYSGAFGLFVVDVTVDRPAYLQVGAVESHFMGWILSPPSELLDVLAGPAIHAV